MSLVDFGIHHDPLTFSSVFRARVMVDGQLKHVAQRLTDFQARGITRVRAAVMAERLPKHELPPRNDELPPLEVD